MRLIDADALKYEPLPKGDRNYRTYNIDDAYDDGYDDAFVDINNAPTIDAVPVIRCKDCKYYNKLLPISSGATCDLLYGMTDLLGYCSLGERRE